MKSTKFSSRVRDFDALGDYFKNIEATEANRKVIPGLPVIARLDGQSFHTFTKGMKKPFYDVMSQAMIDTTKFLVEEFNPTFAYTQSDEISLVFYIEKSDEDMMYAGRLVKLLTSFAAKASSKFMERTILTMPDRAHLVPSFDCRLFQVSHSDVMDYIKWRVMDASRNSIYLAAYEQFSHKELQGVSVPTKLQMLKGRGIEWANFPTFFKEGTFIKKVPSMKYLSEEELQAIPEKHRPSGPILRKVISILDIPRFDAEPDLKAKLLSKSYT